MNMELRGQNCLSYWFPKIMDLVPVPKTEIIHTSVNLIETVTQPDVMPKGFDDFIKQLGDACDEMGYPCFLRTGHTSGKFEWRDTCFVASREVLPAHVAALVEYSECVDLIGLPYHVWAVRELLPTRSYGTAFRGMPVCKEFRVFVEGPQVRCWHPYWPENSFKGNLPAEYNELCKLEEEDQRIVLDMASKVGYMMNNQWSVDVLLTDRGWYVTDMARAESSWHWPECPNAGV